MVDALNSDTRSGSMLDGVGRARQDTVQTVQQLVHPSYFKTSVLEPQQPNPNGLTRTDLQNQMFGTRSLGMDSSTSEKSVWMRNPTNPGLYKANVI